MNITGKVSAAEFTAFNNKNLSATGALYWDKTYTQSGGAGSGDTSATLCLDASKKWTGSTSAGTSHNHTFSSSATIGSGNYTRPNSVSCLYLISY